MTATPFAERALAEIPKLLTLQDRNPHSPTYGCFDRNYWQYRIVDFPTGMAQEFVWPLALAWDCDLPDNPFFRSPQVRDWVEAGIRFAALSARADGSCDDFFPFERAAGAAAFSLLACLEAAELIGLRDAEVEAFLLRRGRWLAGHRESGRLSNHEALIALALRRLSGRSGDAGLDRAAEDRLARLLSWQHPEGWFWEYEGCDPGYQSLTLGLLATLDAIRPDPRVAEAARRCLAATLPFMHPDGSFGGEYGSRNTLNFFPHGFELLGRRHPEALAANDRFLAALAAGRAPCYADDHMIAHHLWSYLLAHRHFAPARPQPGEADGRVHLPAAGLLADRRGGTALFVATNKGGVFKLFRDGRAVASDTGLSLRLKDGRTVVAHLIGEAEVSVSDDRIEVAAPMGFAKQRLMGPWDNLALRGFMLTVGRFFADQVRRLVQAMLITGRKPAPFRFRRAFERDGAHWIVRDEAAGPWHLVAEAGIGGHQGSIFVVQSRVYAPAQLDQPWLDLTDRVRGLQDGAPLRLERRL